MLIDHMQSQGTWLFRWRSYVPLVLFPLVIAAVLRFDYPFESHALDLLREMTGLLLAMCGLALRAATVGFVPKGTSGRNTTRIKADTLNTTGAYSVVRNPLYVANYVIFCGVMVSLGSWWVMLCASIAYWFYYERIILAEERFLVAKFGERFERWADHTPAVIPRISNWSRPNLSFAWRSVLRREYTTVFVTVLAFTVIEIAGDYVVLHTLEFDPVWLSLFLSATAFYLVIRFLKKRTHLLDVSGR